MPQPRHPATRRDFVKTTGTALAASVVAGSPLARAAADEKRRYAIVGTGIRGTTMWGQAVAADYLDVVDFVGLCDPNPKRMQASKAMMGISCPTFTDFDRMCDDARPDLLMVTTVDAFHSEYIVRALDRGIDVITEKPMVIDEEQCQAVLDAEKRNDRQIVVTFNYRYAPKHQKIKEILMAGDIGRLTSVDFSWYLDVSHGADYFRRWHRLRSRGGTLWVHKATHHFDLINWWLAQEPVEVSAFGSLQRYGRKGPYRSETCRGCPHAGECRFYWDITKDPQLVELYVDAESVDGYHRDGCVFRNDCDIFDTMNAVVRYDGGVQMSYSVNAFMPFEGYRLAFNGEKGRLEIRDYERQPWTAPEETEIWLTRSFEGREKIEVPRAEGGHGGGDRVLRDLVFRGVSVPDHLRLPGSRAGALSCLTGIAARTSCDEGRRVRIDELVQL
jgi:predicted dehydrogenase